MAMWMLCLTALSSCALKKNTSLTRFWHSLNTRYNIYYNGAQAYIEGSKEKEKGNKDNYTEQIPLYTVSNKSSRDLGKGNFETAITKAEKAIQLHSIKTKPEWNKERRKTPEDIEWLSRKEYNPFLWRAWMLMGRSQFYKGEFDEAAATFNYMSRLYKGQPSIYGKARAWLAKCYIESGWIYDAEDVIRNQMRDSIDWRAQKEWDYTLCDYYLHTGDLTKSAEYLRKVIRHEMRRKQRAREYFLLGQIEAAQGHKQQAYEAFRKVTRMNPPYELQFNARIAMTEVLAEGQSRKMISRLRRMARNENNKDYLDQVYYAMGNIYLAEKDTANAIAAYEKGNEKATRAGVEKGVLLLHLGDLYWIKEKYGDAKRCYGEAIGLLDKERPDYEQLSKRSKVLDELVPYTDAIYLQDSLLALSEMPEKERLEAIDRVIKELKRKEKEEQAKLTDAEVEKRKQQYALPEQQKQPETKGALPAAGAKGGAWYFYNSQAVMQGKQAFQRTWGRRENVDDWRRNNRTVVADNTEEIDESQLTEEQRDSLAAVRDQVKEEEETDSAQFDPHRREYYLAQIPFTEEQKAECHNIIKEGLFKSGVIFKDKLDNLRLSEKQFDRLRRDYDDYEPKDETYYHLFLLHSRKGDHDVAKTFIDSLTEYCPDSKYTVLLTDPYFEENARFGKHIEDSLYGATYEAFKEDRFQEVYANAAISEKRFPLGDNRDRFLFFYGMARLNDGQPDSCVAAMEKVVSDYPQSPVSEMAGMIINGVRSGRQIYGGKFDLSDVWNRRGITLGNDAIDTTRTFSKERNTEFAFLMAYAPDSVNENQLLFQMARYNFTSFMVRSFDIDIENSYGMHHMIVSGFRNFDEARQYSRLLLQQEGVRRVMGKARPIVISEENLQLIGTRYSYNDYDTFYVSHFAPLPMERHDGLYEATEVKTEDSGTRLTERDEQGEEHAVDYDPVKPLLPTEEVAPGGAKPVDPEKKADDAETDTDDIGGVFNINAGTEVANPKDEGIDIAPAEETPQPAEDNAFDIPETKEEQKPAEDNAFDILDTKEEQKAAEDNAFDIPETKEEQKPAEDNAFDILDTKEEQKAAEDNAFDILDTKEEQKTAEDNAFDILDTKEEQKTAEDNAFDIPETKEEQKAAEDNNFDILDTKEEQKAAEEEGFEFTTDEPQAQQSDDEGIEIDIDNQSGTAEQGNDEYFDLEGSEEGKKSSRDLEDEYYELEGF